MNKPTSSTSGSRTQRICIWTILNQDLIVYYFKVYMVMGCGVMLLLPLSGRLSFDTVMHGMVVGGLSIFALVSLLIHARRKVLLEIADPAIREAAHNAMLLYLSRKPLSPRQRRLLVRRLGRRAEALLSRGTAAGCRKRSAACRET